MSRCAVLVLLLAATHAAYADSSSGSGSSSGYSQTHQAVVGGSTVEPGQWPDAVAVLGTSGTCTGTLIAPDVVLTAGHCAGIKPVQVIANTTDYSQDDGIRVQVAKTEAYPSWQTEYDVAVLLLASEIKGVTPRKVGTACTFDAFSRDTAVRLVGFGATDMNGVTANTQLRQAMTAVLDPDCSDGRGCKQAVAPGGEFVAGGTGSADSCFGDSGGPVYLDTPAGTVVVGAVSRGVDGSATPCGGGGIYVRTDKLIDWIEETTERGLDVDACDGESAYRGEVPAGEAEQVGCSAGRGGALGLVPVVMLALRKRRR